LAALSLPRLPASLRPNRAVIVLGGVAALALALAGAERLIAQIEGDRGIPPIASNGDFEVTGIEVNTTGDNAEEARMKGWAEAQRKAWEKLWSSNSGGATKAPALSDEAIDAMVSAVVVEREQLGPHRYIATLGVIFDRARAGELLGLSGVQARSAPLLVIPVLYQGGVASVFETRTPWQKAWAEFRTGGSAIDYVRSQGDGSDSLLLTASQLDRRSRTWWRLILDEFGAADVLMPIARLERQFPGGPIRGTFTARYGPDNRFLGSFTMSANDEAALPGMLAKAIERLDQIYAAALAAGTLAPDKTLFVGQQVDEKLIAEIVAREAPAPAPTTSAPGSAVPGPVPTAAAAASTFTVQISTPEPASIDAGLASVRAIAGVQGVSISSVAVGGTSVMRVTYTGDLGALAAALRGRGWQVTQGANALSIRK
jgi:hypothetical protein